MRRFVRGVLMGSSLALAGAAGGCANFDPSSLTDIFDSKKPLPGNRQAVFPEGVPGVRQGVPPELVRGYQAPAAEPTPTTADTRPVRSARDERRAAVNRDERRGPGIVPGTPAARSAVIEQNEPDTPRRRVRTKKARPRVAAKPRETAKPKREPKAQSAQPANQPAPVARGQTQWPDPPPTTRQQPDAASPWPTPQRQSAPQVQWPDPPKPAN